MLCVTQEVRVCDPPKELCLSIFRRTQLSKGSDSDTQVLPGLTWLGREMLQERLLHRGHTTHTE